jgi:PD-(D/E)XK nuclease superfamily
MSGMQMDAGDARLVGPVTGPIILCAFRMANAPGHGFVAKVWKNTVAHEMRTSEFGVVQQRGSVVVYANLIIEDQVIVELNEVGARSDGPVPQCRTTCRRRASPSA